MVYIINSDLLTVKTDYIAHQVNCQGVMGAGLALALRKSEPDLYRSYQCYCNRYTPTDLLGTYFIHNRVISVFGQLNYGRDRSVVYTDYSALNQAFRSIHNCLPLNKSIAFPFGFGCGLANGEWNIVKQLIVTCFPNRTIYICKK
jgi:O-acetyl-ADP-ribose deacetylase (regulator of RNase III)